MRYLFKMDNIFSTDNFYNLLVVDQKQLFLEYQYNYFSKFILVLYLMA